MRKAERLAQQLTPSWRGNQSCHAPCGSTAFCKGFFTAGAHCGLAGLHQKHKCILERSRPAPAEPHKGGARGEVKAEPALPGSSTPLPTLFRVSRKAPPSGNDRSSRWAVAQEKGHFPKACMASPSSASNLLALTPGFSVHPWTPCSCEPNGGGRLWMYFSCGG